MLNWIVLTLVEKLNVNGYKIRIRIAKTGSRKKPKKDILMSYILSYILMFYIVLIKAFREGTGCDGTCGEIEYVKLK